MPLLPDPAPDLKAFVGPESQHNFRRAELNRRLSAAINIETGEIILAIGATANMPALNAAATTYWGSHHYARLAAPGRESEHLTASRPIAPRRYPPSEAARVKSTIGGKRHLPLVFLTNAERYGRKAATVHNQMLRIAYPNADENEIKLVFLGFSFFKVTDNTIKVKFRSGTLNRDKQDGVEQTLQNEAWKALIVKALKEHLNVSTVQLDVPSNVPQLL